MIFNEHDACLRLKNNQYGWLRLNDEYFVAGLENYFNTAFTKFYKEKINSLDELIKLLKNNIEWLESQQNLWELNNLVGEGPGFCQDLLFYD